MPDTSKLGYHSWLSGGLLYFNEYPVLLVGSESGGLLLFRSAIDREVSEQEGIRLIVYPNPSLSDDLLRVSTNRDGFVYFYNTLGQLLEKPLNIEKYKVRQFEFGHLPVGVYIVKFVDQSGNSATKRFIRY
jgi:hypothetical protein